MGTRATPPGVVWAVACADRLFRHPGLPPEVVEEDAEFAAMGVDVLLERLDRNECGPHMVVKCELMPVFEWPDDIEPLTAEEVQEQVAMAEECYSPACQEARDSGRALSAAIERGRPWLQSVMAASWLDMPQGEMQKITARVLDILVPAARDWDKRFGSAPA